MAGLSALNRQLDELPWPWRGALWRRGPTFRACGVTGFYAATTVCVLGALLTSASVWVAVLVSCVSAVSFFVCTYLRKAITGREQLVLLEQVWFAELANVAVLYALGLPVLVYLDHLAVALCVFLAAGRAGCLLVGCCHGQPSRLGIVYGDACAEAGFPRYLVGVRLFPVQLVELVGLLVIGLLGAGLWLAAPVGATLVWFLIAYAVMRFGLEEVRGDERPYFAGLSQAQWMSIAEVGAALSLSVAPLWLEHPELVVATLGVAALLLVGGLTLRWRLDRAPALLGEAPSVRRLARTAADGASAPALARTERSVGVVSSPVEQGGLHVSVSLPEPRHDLRTLAELVSRALPEADASSARTFGGQVLHVYVPRIEDSPPTPSAAHARQLYGAAVRAAQASAAHTRAAEVREVAPDHAHDNDGAPPSRAAYFGAQEG